MKIYVSDSILSIIFKIVFLIPPVLFIVDIVNNPQMMFLDLIFIVVFSFGNIILFNSIYGFVLLKNNYIFVSKDLFLQTKLKVYIKDIIAIEFLKEECGCDGKKIKWRYIGTPKYLKIYLNDETKKRICLHKFSFNTWKKIENYLLEANKNIIVLKGADSFKKDISK